MNFYKLSALLAAGVLVFSSAAMAGCSDNNANNDITSSNTSNVQNSTSDVSKQSSESSSEGFRGNQLTQKAIHTRKKLLMKLKNSWKILTCLS